eukprot:TRINITY_DN3607_c0_g1_i1.p1 TRINITY_DN3607_c0_g1~~TRINITY_DN3607_c0_g1_i1.p1  ORF type:complete len:442 (+),score=180.26 TRINITY_DN3607_c0_g1_i1:79-1326(+)
MEKKIESRLGDLDEVFGFQTAKVVVIKDRFLGLLAIGLKIAILMYIIFTVIVDKGYFLVEVPRGTSRMTLRIPEVAENASLPYCTNSPGPVTGADTVPLRLECAYVDSHQLNVPSLGSQFFITTRLNRTLNNYTCDLADYACQKPESYPASTDLFTGFIGGIEEATLLLIHTIEGRGQISLEKHLTEMHGVVKNCRGDVVKELPKRDSADSNNQDILKRIIKVRELVSWARPGMHSSCDKELSLDDLTKPDGISTLRYDGMILHILIEYDNTEGSDTDEVEYTVSVTALTQADPKYESLSQIDDKQFTLDNRHGLHIIVVQTGKLGQFSFAALVISMTAGLGLLAVANTITDLLAKYAMPLREEYKKLIFEYSQDFSDFKKARALQKKKGNLDGSQLSDPQNVELASPSSAYSKL